MVENGDPDLNVKSAASEEVPYSGLFRGTKFAVFDVDVPRTSKI